MQQRYRLRRRWWILLPAAVGAAMVANMACTSMGSVARGDRLLRMQRSAQYGEDRFVNKLPAIKMGAESKWTLVKKWLGGDEVRIPEAELPLMQRRTEEFSVPPADGLRLTWLGHSTFIIEIDGYRLLTDPAMSGRASPFNFVGPQRFYSSPLEVGDLPHLDGVLFSHDHYDHLDYRTVIQLNEQTDVIFYVPLGIGAHLEGWGVEPARIVELDWWQEAKVHGLTLVATPARHFSGRGLLDRDATLWCSWTVIGPQHRVFFSGDTAMFKGFAEIGARFGPFDATMIETGAYNDAWADVHLGPEQAVQAHQDLRGKLYLPIHWGTFKLAFHAWTEPIERLMVAADKAGIAYVVPKPGESVEPSRPQAVVRWWPQVPWQNAEQAPVVSSGLGEAKTQLSARDITQATD